MPIHLHCEPSAWDCAMNNSSSFSIELASLAFLELTPALREQIKLQLPPECTPEHANSLYRQKAWSALCHAAKQSGKQPMEYAEQIVTLYRDELQRSGRSMPSTEQSG